jgi:MarR family transcriptional regulator, transcriptional regulator for hemolysin
MHDFKWVKSHGLGFLISDTARLLRKRFDQRARELGMTRAQWQVLAYLAMNEGINQSGLAEILDVEPITLSRHLDKLEQAGWVIRKPDPNDRRARHLILSESAAGELMKIRKVGRCLMEDITAGLTPEQIDALRGGLQHVRDALSRLKDTPVEANANPESRVLQ